MKVLLVCNYKAGVGGISGQVDLLRRKLCEEGIETEVFSTKASLWKRLWMKPKLRCRASDCDVIHIHCCSNWGFLPAVLGVTVGHRLGKRVVLTYHGGAGDRFFNRYPRLVRHYLSQTDTNIVLSGYLAEVFEKHGLPCVIVPNVIEMDDTHFRLRNAVAPNYICTRTHEPLYNIPCILRAFQKVQALRPEATLTLVGDGSQHLQLMRQVDKMGLQHVVFTGRVENKDVRRYLDQADVLLSAPTADNMPVSLLEAMNAGLLVIASRVGGVPFIVEDGMTGLLFENGSYNELAEKMVWPLEHPEEAQSLMMRARQSIRQYQWDNVKQKLFEAYGIRS